MVENPRIAVGITTLSITVPCRVQIKYFRFRRPYCYFRLSVVFAIIWGHYPWTLHGWKPQNCRWYFDAIYRSSRDISISGLDDHIAISGCQSLSQSLSLNSPWSKPQVRYWKRTHLLFYSNPWGFFLPQSATRVRKNRSAIRELNAL